MLVLMEICMQLMKFPSRDLSRQSVHAKSQVPSFLKKQIPGTMLN
jgi:hypothetical protein